MKTFTLRLVVWLLPFAVYAASPFATAWTLKEAIRSGDAGTIDQLVAWDSVRATLRRSMTSLALDRPMAFNAPGASSIAGTDAGAAQPGWWRRVKDSLGTAAVDRLVDRYANADGLPTLFAYGQAYRRYVVGVEDPPKTLANLPERLRAFWARVRHAEFVSPVTFEIEVADKTDPARRFTGLLEFRDLRWRLTELYVHTATNPMPRLAALAAARDPDAR
jgi:hypothetical protein